MFIYLPFCGFPSHSGHHCESSSFPGYPVYSLVLSILCIVWIVYMCQSQPPSTSHPTCPLMVLRRIGQEFCQMYLNWVCWKLFFPSQCQLGDFVGGGRTAQRYMLSTWLINCDADFDHEVKVVSANPLYGKVTVFLFILKLFSLFVRSQLISGPHPKGVELVVMEIYRYYLEFFYTEGLLLFLHYIYLCNHLVTQVWIHIYFLYTLG